MRFKNKTVIVTGAGGGIGKAVALRFAREGANVALVDLNRGKLDEVAAAILAAHGNALPLGVDIARNDDVKAMAVQVLDAFGQIDILVNNAGAGWQEQRLLKDIPDGAWEWILDVNLKGAIHCIRAVLDHMTARQSGKIINVASVAASVGMPNLAIYAASKGALVALTKSLAMELGPSGININCVSPGLVARETEPIQPSNGTFLGRKGRPEEFAAVIAFMASEEAAFITGVDYLVDGGRVLGPRGA